MEKILITRLGAMGDIIHSLPAAAALRRAFPQATIGWVVEERWLDLLSASSGLNAERGGTPERPLVDYIHISNTRAWRLAPFSDETWLQMRALFHEARAPKYELAVDLQAAARSAFIGWLSGAAARVGFRQPRERWARLFYTRTVETHTAHVVEQGLELATAVTGHNIGEAEFPLPRDPEAEAWCSTELARIGLGDQPFAMLSPGAGWGAKCWPADRYGAVAQSLQRERLGVIANFGPGEEVLARAVVEASQGTARPVTCTIGQLIALTRRARLFLGGDSGPTHLAAALGIPVVAIYGPTNPARNGPYGPRGSREIVLRSQESKTSHSRRSEPEQGLLQIELKDVLQSVETLLRERA
jgi:lipopolysaccharide heptosyltransferase I